jgi:hypothetical protein
MAEALIAVKELVPLVVAVTVWGRQWAGSTVMCKCDNQAVVAVVMSRTAHDKHIMQLLRCLFFFEAKHNCCLVASHIHGVQNDLADDLPCNRLSSFLPRAPPAVPPTPHTVSQALQDLVRSHHDWTSETWRSQFTSI